MFNLRKTLVSKNKDTSYCSVDCSAFLRRKVERPTKEQLIIDINTLPFTKIGIKYGVSDNAVRKWAKKYELTR